MYSDFTAKPIFSWNITVDSITSSSATVRWSNFPLPLSINHYLVRFKEVYDFGTLFQVSSHSNYYYTNILKGYTSYDVEVLAVTTSDGNVTYSSKTVSMKTAEGGKCPYDICIMLKSITKPYLLKSE